MTSTIAKVVRKTSHLSFSAAPREAFHPCHLCHPCGLFYFSQISQISQIFVCSPLSFIIFGFVEDAHARHSSNKFGFCTRSIASFISAQRLICWIFEKSFSFVWWVGKNVRNLQSKCNEFAIRES